MHSQRIADPTTHLATPLNGLHMALLVIVSTCVYLHVPLVAGGRLVMPSFPTVALIPFLFLAVRRNVSDGDMRFVFGVAFVLLLSIALSPGYKHIQQKFFSLFQFTMAVAVAVLIVRLMLRLRYRSLERALLILWVALMLGAVLEVIGVIKAASDSFREWAYAGTYTLYDADLRDLGMVGWERPKLFSSEPSHLTKFFIAAINSWLLVQVTWRKAAIAAGATLAMLVIMGSPMLLISAAITLAIVVWDRRSSLSGRLITLTVLILVAVVIGAYYASSTYSSVVSRVERVGTSSSDGERGPSSEERRMIIPYKTLADTWLRWPLFGAGVGGKEVVSSNNTLPIDNAEQALGNNAMAQIGTYLGIVGSTLFLILVLWQAGKTGIHRKGLLLLIIGLFSQLMGGVDTFRYWGFVALLWGALAASDQRPSNALARSGINPR